MYEYGISANSGIESMYTNGLILRLCESFSSTVGIQLSCRLRWLLWRFLRLEYRIITVPGCTQVCLLRQVCSMANHPPLTGFLLAFCPLDNVILEAKSLSTSLRFVVVVAAKTNLFHRLTLLFLT